MEDTWRIDVDLMEVLKAPVSTLAGSLMCLADCLLMEVPWRIHGGLM